MGFLKSIKRPSKMYSVTSTRECIFQLDGVVAVATVFGARAKHAGRHDRMGWLVLYQRQSWMCMDCGLPEDLEPGRYQVLGDKKNAIAATQFLEVTLSNCLRWSFCLLSDVEIATLNVS